MIAAVSYPKGYVTADRPPTDAAAAELPLLRAFLSLPRLRLLLVFVMMVLRRNAKSEIAWAMQKMQKSKMLQRIMIATNLLSIRIVGRLT